MEHNHTITRYAHIFAVVSVICALSFGAVRTCIQEGVIHTSAVVSTTSVVGSHS